MGPPGGEGSGAPGCPGGGRWLQRRRECGAPRREGRAPGERAEHGGNKDGGAGAQLGRGRRGKGAALVVGVERLWLHHVPDSAFSGIRPGGWPRGRGGRTSLNRPGNSRGVGPANWGAAQHPSPSPPSGIFCESARVVSAVPPPHPGPTLPPDLLPFPPPPCRLLRGIGWPKGGTKFRPSILPLPLRVGNSNPVRAVPFFPCIRPTPFPQALWA